MGETAKHLDIPVTLAIERRLPLIEALHPLLPLGLERGTITTITGSGATSLACAVAAGPLAGDAWAAVVGLPTLGLVAAEGLGVPLHRLVMVHQPERQEWGTVAAALVDAFDVVVMEIPIHVSARTTRRVEARARERGSVMIGLGGRWPTAADVALHIGSARWEGVGAGHGVVRGRRVAITATGRRGASRPRKAELWLPDAGGVVRAADKSRLTLVGADTTVPVPRAG